MARLTTNISPKTLRRRRVVGTFEHALPLLMQNACPGLQLLRTKEVGYSDRFGLRRAIVDRYLLLLLHLSLLYLSLLLLLGLLLSQGLLLHLVLAHRLLFELLHVLRHSETALRGLFSQLSLHLLNLLRCRLLAGLQRRRGHHWSGHGEGAGCV